MITKNKHDFTNHVTTTFKLKHAGDASVDKLLNVSFTAGIRFTDCKEIIFSLASPRLALGPEQTYLEWVAVTYFPDVRMVGARV